MVFGRVDGLFRSGCGLGCNLFLGKRVGPCVVVVRDVSGVVVVAGGNVDVVTCMFPSLDDAGDTELSSLELTLLRLRVF